MGKEKTFLTTKLEFENHQATDSVIHPERDAYIIDNNETYRSADDIVSSQGRFGFR